MIYIIKLASKRIDNISQYTLIVRYNDIVLHMDMRIENNINKQQLGFEAISVNPEEWYGDDMFRSRETEIEIHLDGYDVWFTMREEEGRKYKCFLNDTPYIFKDDKETPMFNTNISGDKIELIGQTIIKHIDI